MAGAAAFEPLRLAPSLESQPSLDEAGRELLRREYRLIQAASELDARLDGLFDRIRGAEDVVLALRAELDRSGPMPVALGSPGPAAPADAIPVLAEPVTDFESWGLALAAAAAGAVALGALALRRGGTGGVSPEMSPSVPEAETMAPLVATVVLPAPVAEVARPERVDLERTVALPPRALAGDPQAEVASVVDLADVLLHHGRLKDAVERLRDVLARHPAVSVRPWLKLLEAYRAAGMRREFDESARSAHERFNVVVPGWEDGLAGEPLRSFFGPDGESTEGIGLEHLPHIAMRITAAWGTPACRDYLHQLLADNRGGGRSGFPVSVVSEILLLEEVLGCRLAGGADLTGEKET